MNVRTSLAGLALALILPATLQAQDHAAHQADRHPALPDGWMAQFDRPVADHGEHANDGLDFQVMTPGWHVTTGPAGIFYRPEFSADGSYTLEGEIFLFDPGTRRESFGVFFGGDSLHDPETRSYSYFLVRRDGRYMIRTRAGAELGDVQGWTEHAAIPNWDEREADAQTVRYVLAVEVGASEVVFRVNGEEVDRRPRDAFPVDGQFGLRVNHALNLHVSRIEVR